MGKKPPPRHASVERPHIKLFREVRESTEFQEKLAFCTVDEAKALLERTIEDCITTTKVNKKLKRINPDLETGDEDFYRVAVNKESDKQTQINCFTWSWDEYDRICFVQVEVVIKHG